MTVWLIGNRGMLGAEVQSLLEENRIDFLSSDREVDISDPAALQDFVKNDKKIEWIINCSGYTAVDRAEDEPESAFRVNAHGVSNIAETAQALDSTIIHISTDYVFSGAKRSAYREEDHAHPSGVYAKSKLQGELNIRSALKKHYILRTAWLYGRIENNFVGRMLHLFREKDTVRVVADQWGSPTYTRDLAGIILYIIQTDTKQYGTYHYTNEGKTSWFGFGQEIYRQARQIGLISRDIRVLAVDSKEFPTRARRPKNSYLSKEKIKKTFGISIRSWQDALRTCIEEIKRNL